MRHYESYTICGYEVDIAQQDIQPGSGKLDGFGFSVTHTKSGHSFLGGSYDMVEDIYRKILSLIDSHSRTGEYNPQKVHGSKPIDTD